MASSEDWSAAQIARIATLEEELALKSEALRSQGDELASVRRELLLKDRTLQQAQSALDAKEAHAEERLAQMTRLKAEAEYAQQQTAIAIDVSAGASRPSASREAGQLSISQGFATTSAAELSAALAEFIFKNGLAFKVIESKSLARVLKAHVKAARTAPASYKPPQPDDIAQLSRNAVLRLPGGGPIGAGGARNTRQCNIFSRGAKRRRGAPSRCPLHLYYHQPLARILSGHPRLAEIGRGAPGRCCPRCGARSRARSPRPRRRPARRRRSSAAEGSPAAPATQGLA